MTRAVDVLDKGKYYKVSKEVLAHALPHQPPGVDLRNSVAGMNKAIADMRELGYLKNPPGKVVDLKLLNEVVGQG
jgi:hypothetical protein